MRYFFIAGEASGDLHATRLMEELRRRDDTAEFVGLGGDKMRAAGCQILVDYRDMAYMGVVAVLRNLHKIRQNFKIAQKGLLDAQPDVLVLVDYPSFNLKIAAFCRKHLPNTKIYYYIPPKIWAWKTWRVHKIARLCDEVLGIFPFEPAFYAQYGYRCTYVGNPTQEEIAQWKETHAVSEPVAQRPVIAILPGSRKGEISRCLPVMLAAAKEVNDYKQGAYEIAVAGAPGIDDTFYAPYLRHENYAIRLTRETYETVSHAHAAIVNSGTATLETALLGCPQVAVYHISCSKHLMWLKPLIFKIPHFTLVNLIAEKEVIRELVGGYFTQKAVAEELRQLLDDATYRQDMQNCYHHISERLGNLAAARQAVEIIHSRK